MSIGRPLVGIRGVILQLRHGHSQCAQFREVLPQSLCVPYVVFGGGSQHYCQQKARRRAHYTTPPGWRFVLFTVCGVITNYLLCPREYEYENDL